MIFLFPPEELPEIMEVKEQPVISYPPEAVLEIQHVAAWLRVSKRQAEREHIPCFYIGPRRRRFLGEAVIEHLRKKTA